MLRSWPWPIWLHGTRQGLVLWSLVCLVPALFALWTIMVFNYVQHIHTDPWSDHNHSRSFVGFWTNFFLFNTVSTALTTRTPALTGRSCPRSTPNTSARSIRG